MTNEKEKGQTTGMADPLANTSEHANSKPTRVLTPRQYRVLLALMRGGWITREQTDRIAGASNGPEIVRQLRKTLGSNAIETGYTEVIDRDGRPARPGRYRLTQTGTNTLSKVEVVKHDR